MICEKKKDITTSPTDIKKMRKYSEQLYVNDLAVQGNAQIQIIIQNVLNY